MKLNKWQIALRRVGAPEDYYEWCRPYETAQAAWNACSNAGWMVWWLFRINIHDKTRGNDMHRAVVKTLADLMLGAGVTLSTEQCVDVATALQWAARGVSDAAVTKAAEARAYYGILDCCDLDYLHTELPDHARQTVEALGADSSLADRLRALVPWVPWLPGAKQWESDGSP